MKPFWVLVISGLAAAGSAVDAAVQAQVDELIPGLAAADAEQRYEPRMKLQALAAEASKPGAEEARFELEQALTVRALDPKVGQPARVWMIRQFEFLGGAGAVPALARLLGDPDAEIRETARRALELNPAAPAGAALRSALKAAGDPAWRIGLVHSLGRRRDTVAVESVAALLGDPAVGGAAAGALGRIADAAAVEALSKAYDGKSLAIGSALLAAATHQGAGGRAVLSRLIPQGNPPAVRAGAVSAMIRSDAAQAPRWIAAGLAETDVRVRSAAAREGRVHVGPALTTALLASWPKMPASGRALALDLMEEGGRACAGEAVADADPDVAAAAVRLLGRSGGVAVLPTLIGAAAADGSARAAAEQALAELKGDGVSAALQTAASEGDPKRRAVAIAALAARREPGTMTTLVAAASCPDSGVARAAFTALRQAGGDAEVAAVANHAAQGKADAQAALKAMAARARDRKAVSQTLMAAVQAADTRGRSALLESLAVVGGMAALDMTAKFADSPDAALRTAAIRALSNWVEFEAVRPLQALASAPGSAQTDKILAIRGIARLIAQGTGATADQRVTAALDAMKLAPRTEERKLLLPALGSIANPRALAALEPMLADPAMKSEAAFALAALAEAYRDTDRKMARQIADKVEKSDAPEAAKKKAREAAR
jgi:HEAT repeat protein